MDVSGFRQQLLLFSVYSVCTFTFASCLIYLTLNIHETQLVNVGVSFHMGTGSINNWILHLLWFVGGADMNINTFNKDLKHPRKEAPAIAFGKKKCTRISAIFILAKQLPLKKTLKLF